MVEQESRYPPKFSITAEIVHSANAFLEQQSGNKQENLIHAYELVREVPNFVGARAEGLSFEQQIVLLEAMRIYVDSTKSLANIAIFARDVASWLKICELGICAYNDTIVHSLISTIKENDHKKPTDFATETQRDYAKYLRALLRYTFDNWYAEKEAEILENAINVAEEGSGKAVALYELEQLKFYFPTEKLSTTYEKLHAASQSAIDVSVREDNPARASTIAIWAGIDALRVGNLKDFSEAQKIWEKFKADPSKEYRKQLISVIRAIAIKLTKASVEYVPMVRK